MRHALTVTLVLALAAACATPGLPPGGPTVSSFPRVIATLPDTNAVNVRQGKVLVRYDDVIGEQAGGGALSRVVLISPWDGEPKVDWKRTGMSIEPRKGWRANTAYTITILPGVTDIRGKASPYGYVLRFSTAGAIPTSVIRGVAFDWVANKYLPNATIQAVDARDSTLMHVTVADSQGRFELGAVPPGSYQVRAIAEKTPNRLIDPREPWDEVPVTLRDSARAELYVFVHDTLPARIEEVRAADSLTITIKLDKPLLPGAPIAVSNVRIVKADSSELAVSSLLSAPDAEALKAREDSIARANDTTAAKAPATPPTRQRNSIDPTRRRDTVPVVAPPEPSRKPPVTDLVIKVAAPLQPSTTYRITLSGLRTLMNRTGEVSRLLIMPKAAVPDSTRRPAAPRDGAARPPASPPGATGRPARPPR